MAPFVIDPAALRSRAGTLDAIAGDIASTRAEIISALALIGVASGSTAALGAVVGELERRADDLRLRAISVESLRLGFPQLLPSASVASTYLSAVDAIDLFSLTRPEAHEWRAFFAALDNEQIADLVVSRPEMIGSRAGVPFEVRVAANRLLVTGMLAERGAALADLKADTLWANIRDGFDWLPGYDSPDERREALRREVRSLQYLSTQQVVAFDWEGAGSVAVWHGRLDAEHVTLYLPGTGHDKTTMPDLADRPRFMLEEVVTGELAVVTSMVYDAPGNVPEAGLTRYANRAVDPITEFVDGFDDVGHLSILAHSYGSTALGAALSAGLGAQLDPSTDIIIVGSPGTRTDTASELGVDPDHVWVGLLPGDEIRAAGAVDDAWCIQQLARNPLWATCDLQEQYHHGRNPADEDYGAQVFDTGPNPDVRGLNHGKYWTPGSLSLHNLVVIALGRYNEVVLD